MISFWSRLKMARAAFRCKPFEVFIEPYHKVDELKPISHCDNKNRVLSSRYGCQGQAEVCMSRTLATFRVDRDYDHEHLCLECASEIKGKY